MKQSERARRSGGFSRRVRVAATAVLLVALCIEPESLETLASAFVLPARGISSATHLPIPAQGEIVIATAVGEQRSVAFIHGTEIVLNTDTRVHASRKNGATEIALTRGEVVLNLGERPHSPATSETTPVVMRVAGAELRAAGARLSARLEGENACIIHMLAGKGALHIPQFRAGPAAGAAGARGVRVVSLKSGQSAHVRNDAVVISTFDPAGVERELAWMHGEVWLQGQSLSDAAAEFNRYNRQKLFVRDDSIAGLRIGGRFEASDVEGFIDALGQTFGIRALRVGGGEGQPDTVILVGPEVVTQ